jgi:Fis family transcriptional regulator, factor for inversion stimulation protein
MITMDNLMPASDSATATAAPVAVYEKPAAGFQTVPACSLRQEVERSLVNYFEQLDPDAISGLYDLVLAEVEAPLLEAVMRLTGSNQSKASIMLGLNRGTLRKKLKQHGLL